MIATQHIHANSADASQSFIDRPKVRLWLNKLCHLLSATMHFK